MEFVFAKDTILKTLKRDIRNICNIYRASSKSPNAPQNHSHDA